jgi:hypothetical protein
MVSVKCRHQAHPRLAKAAASLLLALASPKSTLTGSTLVLRLEVTLESFASDGMENLYRGIVISSPEVRHHSVSLIMDQRNAETRAPSKPKISLLVWQRVRLRVCNPMDLLQSYLARLSRPSQGLSRRLLISPLMSALVREMHSAVSDPPLHPRPTAPAPQIASAPTSTRRHLISPTTSPPLSLASAHPSISSTRNH